MGSIAKRVALPASVVVLLAAGCGSEDGKDNAYIPAQDPPGEEKQPAAKQELALEMKDIRFNPANVALRAGGTVTWTNEDRVTHNVTFRSGPGPKFRSGDVTPGKRYKRVFDSDEVGLVSYLCTIHANMTGDIRVEE